MGIFIALALAAAPIQANNLQQDFNAASDAAATGDCARAVPLFETLERNSGVKPGSISAAAIQVRKGGCLIQLSRAEEGEAAILTGLPQLERAGDSLSVDVAIAYGQLGDLSLERADYAQARQRYEQALQRQTGTARFMSLIRLAKASSFDPGPQPLAYADEALRIASAQPKPSKNVLSQLHGLHARILLNRGQHQEAYTELKRALSLSGGLTPQTSIGEAAIRGDLALAALLLGKKDDARLYLAWTGAGRITQSPFASAAFMAPPECGEETGLRPDDFAVVEFAIGEDGAVVAAGTIYSRGGPGVAAAFARSVRDWYWQPADLAKIPTFYRVATRVELRCSTAGGPAPNILKPLTDRFADWAMPLLGMAAGDMASRIDAIPALHAALIDREARGDAPGQVAAAGMLALIDPRNGPATVAMLDKAILATGKPGIPVESTNTLRVTRLFAAQSAAAIGRRSRSDPFQPAEVLALAQDAAVAGDALTANTLLLKAAMPYRSSTDTEQNDRLLKQVAGDERLAATHPLRQVAMLKLANIAAAAGDLAAAQAFFARTGLSEQQCALIGARPALKQTGASGAFPMEALQYGFEGWVRLEFDITAAGRVANPRAVIAYPPNVFVDAATGMTRNVRYEATYRPSGGVACSADGETVRFIIPSNH